jgi:hypothetical protein
MGLLQKKGFGEHTSGGFGCNGIAVHDLNAKRHGLIFFDGLHIRRGAEARGGAEFAEEDDIGKEI